jgi:hypothetical protein
LSIELQLLAQYPELAPEAPQERVVPLHEPEEVHVGKHDTYDPSFTDILQKRNSLDLQSFPH